MIQCEMNNEVFFVQRVTRQMEIEELTEEQVSAEAKVASPVLVNITQMNRDRYFEAAMLRGKAWKNRIFAILAVIFAVVGGLMMNNMLVFVLCLLIALLAMFGHVILAYRDFGKLKNHHPTGEWTKTIRFYPDRVETDSGIGSVSIATYRDIKHEYESEHMYLIDFGGKAPATTLCKDSFTVGSIEELRAFLLERRRAEYDA